MVDHTNPNSTCNAWKTTPGDPGWPRSLRLDPAGPIMADAVVALVRTRARKPLGDGSEALQALVDLIAVSQASLPDAVADARDQWYSWEHIAAVLGISPDVAVRRYSCHWQRRRSPLELD